MTMFGDYKNNVYTSHERVILTVLRTALLPATIHSRNLIVLFRNDACAVNTLLYVHQSAPHARCQRWNRESSVLQPLTCRSERLFLRRAEGQTWRAKRTRKCTSYWQSIDVIFPSLYPGIHSVVTMRCGENVRVLFSYVNEPL